MNNETISGLIVHCVFHVLKSDRDLISVKGRANKDILDGDSLRVRVNHAVCRVSVHRSDHSANSGSAIDQAYLLGVGHLDRAGRRDGVHRSELQGVQVDLVSLERALLDAV